MINEINRICPYCSQKLKYEIYSATQTIAYCDNDDCIVQPCTDSTLPSNVYKEILAITGDEK